MKSHRIGIKAHAYCHCTYLCMCMSRCIVNFTIHVISINFILSKVFSHKFSHKFNCVMQINSTVRIRIAKIFIVVVSND